MKATITIMLALMVQALLPAGAFAAWPPAGYDEIPWQDIPVASDSILARTRRWKRTTNATISVRPPVQAPVFYKGLGAFDGYADYAELAPYLDAGHRPLLVFKDIDAAKVDAQVQALIPGAVCVFDFEAGEFDGPRLKDFVRDMGATEILLSWGYANNIDQPDQLEAIAAEVAGAVEFAKRGDPGVFVWVTVCAGMANTQEWADHIKQIPFDGVALWNIHSLPKGWQEGFLDKPLAWARATFDNRPVALAGLHGAKAWKAKTPESIAAMKAWIQTEVPKAIVEAERLGYTTVWQQIGGIPGEVYPACDF